MKFINASFLLFLSLAISLSAFAQDAIPGSGFFEAVLSFLDSLDGATLVIVAGVFEFALRLIPSEKPVGILRSTIGVSKVVGNILLKFAEKLDQVIPQNVKKDTNKIQL